MVGMPLCLNAPVAMPLLRSRKVTMLQPLSCNANIFWNTVVAMLHCCTECPIFVCRFLGNNYMRSSSIYIIYIYTVHVYIYIKINIYLL